MIYRFADCELDTTRHALMVGGGARHVEPQVFDLLRLLAERPGELISREALIETVWGGRIVSESAIDARINAARRAVGDDGRAQRVIRTVPRRGIRLVPPVAVLPAPGDAAPVPRAEPGPEGQRVRFARSVDGARLAFATTGHGVPLVRGSHWLTHLELDWLSPIWRPLLDALGRDFAITRWDQRGTGLSGRESVNFDLEVMTADLEAVADAAGLDRFPIFAASQAVPVAVTFAARYPERVSRLVLYGGFAAGRGLRAGPEAMIEHEAFLTLIRAGWGQPDSAFMRAFTTIYMPDATPEQLESFVEMQCASASPGTAARLREATGMFDVRDALAEVRAPTLVLHARRDAVVPLAEGQALAAGIPGAELMVLESRNHIPLPHDPAWGEMMAATTDFLSAGRRGG
jgi:DNA-binding winged helix-turn-helix (wHTH) protein/alpha-beta hydrolase superfamily lysophospholipase